MEVAKDEKDHVCVFMCRMNGICVSECVSVRLRGVCGRGVCVLFERQTL